MTRVSQFPKPFAIRDPIYGFIELDDTERAVLDSRPLQRLKHIHQLAMTYQIYPGATHKRFEHSLGVMELAGRAFDALTHPTNRNQEMEDAFPEIFRKPETEHILAYWRRVVRLAGLCHDIGHLPFSHAAEEHLLGKGGSHEGLGAELMLKNKGLRAAMKSQIPPVDPIHVVKLAIGQEKCDESGLRLTFTNWETLLSGIVIDDLLGADRMDYLIRDSHHVGVAYGRFDVDRLVQSLRVLPSLKPVDERPLGQFQLGVDIGGVLAVAGLLLARYFMFVQVYFHHTRVAFDWHLREFVIPWAERKFWKVNRKTILKLTDDRILTAVNRYAKKHKHKLSAPAKKLRDRDHFKTLATLQHDDMADDETVKRSIELMENAGRKFDGVVKFDCRRVKLAKPDIPVSDKGEILALSSASGIAASFMEADTDDGNLERKLGFLFIERGEHRSAETWFRKRHRKLLRMRRKTVAEEKAKARRKQYETVNDQP